MFLVAPDPTAGTADTYGWDTVSAVRAGDMNAAIAIARTSPAEFAETVDGAAVSARFGDWQVGSGGDGKLIHMLLPLHEIEMRMDGEVTLAGNGVAEISVHLNFLPHDVPDAAGTDARILKLMVDTHREKAVSVLEITYERQPSIFVRSAVFAALDAWLVERLEEFRHVFACVNIDRVVETDAFPWLKPSYVSYAFAADEDAPERSQFAILCQTAGRSGDDLVDQIGPHTIPAGCAAGFLISSTRFTRDMLSPGLKHTFLKGVTKADGKTTETDGSVSFKGEKQLEFVEADGKTYTPVLEELVAELHETSLHIETLTRTYVAPGIWSMTSYKADYVFGLVKNTNGEKTIGFLMRGKPDSTSWPKHDVGIVIVEVILAIIAVIVLAVVAAVSLGMLVVPALAIGAVLLGTGAIGLGIGIADMVARGDGPPLNLMLANATDGITWAHGSAFDPEYVAINGSLQFGGTLRASSGGLLHAARDEIRAFQERFGAYEREAA